jgi:lantibiotic modifying enzyme
LFSPLDASWPAAAPEADDLGTTMGRMSAWCHGAPGISLAAASCLDISTEPTMLTQVRAALGCLARWGPNQADHLCCGHFGRVDVLLTAGRRLDMPEAEDAARSLAARVLARARARHHFRLSTPGIEYRVFDPGFFRGLSGIGYELLRLAAPARLPSILRFDAVGNLL